MNFARNSKALTRYYYIVYCLLYVNWNALGSVVMCCAGNFKDLGSSPRSGKISMLFFNTLFHAALIVVYTIFYPPPSVHMPNGYRSRVEIEGPLSLGQRVGTPNWRSQWINSCWARTSRPEPPYLGQHPTLVCFPYLFYYFNYCVIYFYCFN